MLCELFFASSHAHIARMTYDWIEIDSQHMFLTHYNDLALPMAQS